jgi:hypothetical protein
MLEVNVVLASCGMAPAASADSFVDTAPGSTSFTVPPGVSSLGVSAIGGAGLAVLPSVLVNAVDGWPVAE